MVIFTFFFTLTSLMPVPILPTPYHLSSKCQLAESPVIQQTSNENKFAKGIKSLNNIITFRCPT